MKKIISIILIVCMLCSISITAFAADDLTYVSEDGGSAETILYYEAPSSFTVVIPKELTLNGIPLGFTGVGINIPPDMQVGIYCDAFKDGNIIEFYNGDKTIEVSFRADEEDIGIFENGLVAVLYDGDFTAKGHIRGSLITEKAKAGTYSRTVEFTVVLEPKTN